MNTVKALKALVNAARRTVDGRLCLWVEVDPSRESWSNDAIAEMTLCSKVDGIATKQTVDVKARILNGHTSETETYEYEGRKLLKYCETYRPLKGTWSLYGAQDQVFAAIDALSNKADVFFYVGLDSGTNDNCVHTGMHVDVLYLVAREEGKPERKFQLDVSVGPHNTARFGNSRFL